MLNVRVNVGLVVETEPLGITGELKECCVNKPLPEAESVENEIIVRSS